MDTIDTMARLFAPFALNEVRLRPGHKMGSKFRVFAYVDKHALARRLDAVLSPANWQSQLEAHQDGFICHLLIRLDSEWIVRDGVGAPAAESVRAFLLTRSSPPPLGTCLVEDWLRYQQSPPQATGKPDQAQSRSRERERGLKLLAEKRARAS